MPARHNPYLHGLRLVHAPGPLRGVERGVLDALDKLIARKRNPTREFAIALAAHYFEGGSYDDAPEPRDFGIKSGHPADVSFYVRNIMGKHGYSLHEDSDHASDANEAYGDDPATFDVRSDEAQQLTDELMSEMSELQEEWVNAIETGRFSDPKRMLSKIRSSLGTLGKAMTRHKSGKSWWGESVAEGPKGILLSEARPSAYAGRPDIHQDNDDNEEFKGLLDLKPGQRVWVSGIFLLGQYERKEFYEEYQVGAKRRLSYPSGAVRIELSPLGGPDWLPNYLVLRTTSHGSTVMMGNEDKEGYSSYRTMQYLFVGIDLRNKNRAVSGLGEVRQRRSPHQDIHPRPDIHKGDNYKGLLNIKPGQRVWILGGGHRFYAEFQVGAVRHKGDLDRAVVMELTPTQGQDWLPTELEARADHYGPTYGPTTVFLGNREQERALGGWDSQYARFRFLGMDLENKHRDVSWR